MTAPGTRIALPGRGSELSATSARLLVLDFDGFQGDGFASIVHRTASSIAEAFYENRTVVLGPTALAYKPGPWNCAGHDLFWFRRLAREEESDDLRQLLPPLHFVWHREHNGGREGEETFSYTAA